MPKDLTKPFILILVFLVSVGAYFVFRPFLKEIIMAIVIASVFYPVYDKLVSFLKGRRNLAAVLMCLFLVLIVIIPSIKMAIYAGEKSVEAYTEAAQFFETNNLNDVFKTATSQKGVLKYLGLDHFNINETVFKDFSLSLLKELSNWLLEEATIILRETTNFIASLVFIILAMFFFFVDGKKMLEGIMSLSPLPEKYNLEIFKRFRAVSYTAFVSTFIVAISQGVVGAIGFAIIGFSPFLAGVIVAILSLLPIGSVIFYVPVGLYYLLTGDIWQGLFIIIWGLLVISLIDNVLRTFLIKDGAQVNPIFILFSILGGVLLFGFWGVILGPLVISLAVTIFHIYGLEFCTHKQ